ncbi:hypothetical protein, partial [Pseudactinotalea sp.]|uniref:hypothetical protein n=1 Tax=Pseudactinotalea sp. TaxID=1926260 RepID=UPI003B3A96B8
RAISLDVPEAVLDRRRTALEASGGYKPKDRQRPVSAALRAYAAFAQSADKGAIRIVPEDLPVVTAPRSAAPGGEEVLQEPAALVGSDA